MESAVREFSDPAEEAGLDGLHREHDTEHHADGEKAEGCLEIGAGIAVGRRGKFRDRLGRFHGCLGRHRDVVLPSHPGPGGPMTAAA